MSSIDILKLQLNDFFERSKKDTHTTIVNKESRSFNKSLLELEKHLYDLKKQYDVNQNIDCRIVSPHILESFKKSPDFYRSDDYLLSFLVFLAIQPEYNADYLLESMDRYVDLVKDKLSYSDIIITATGATRCYTNLRFALNKLRNFGLVHHTTRIDHSIKRSLLPTPFGYLVAAYVSHFKEADVQNLLDNKITKSSPNFYNLVVQFKRDTVGFIDQVTLKTENIELVELVDPIRESFKAIASNIKFSESYNSEDIEKTELKMKEFYRNDENQQSISLEMNRLIVSR